MKKNDLLEWYTKHYKKSFNEETIFEKLKTIIAERFCIDISQVVPEANFIDLDAYSTNNTCDLELIKIELIMDIEDEFDVEIPDEKAEEILAVQDIVSYLLSSSSSELAIEVTKALNKIADSVDEISDSIEKHQVKKTDDIKSLILEASNIGLIEKRNKVKRVFNLLQELNITGHAEAIELIEWAMNHQYIAHSNKVEGLYSLLNSSASTAIGELQNKHTDFTQQLTLLLIERAEGKKKEKKALITQEIEKLRSSLAELE